MRELPLPEALEANVLSLEAGLLRGPDLGRLQTLMEMETTAKAAADRWDAAARTRFRTARLEGWREGRDAGAEQTGAALREMRNRLDALEASTRDDVTAWATHAVRLLLAALPEAELIEGAVRKALQDNAEIRAVTLRVTPTLSNAAGSSDFCMAPMPGRQLEIVTDPTLSSRTAVLETAVGNLELSEGAMMEAVDALLTGSIGAEPGMLDDTTAVAS